MYKMSAIKAEVVCFDNASVIETSVEETSVKEFFVYGSVLQTLSESSTSSNGSKSWSVESKSGLVAAEYGDTAVFPHRISLSYEVAEEDYLGYYCLMVNSESGASHVGAYHEIVYDVNLYTSWPEENDVSFGSYSEEKSIWEFGEWLIAISCDSP